MMDNKDQTSEEPDIYHHLSEAYLQHQMARKPVSNLTRQALTWNAQVKRKRGPDLATAGRETLKQSNREPTGVTRKPVTCYSNQILKQNSS